MDKKKDLVRLAYKNAKIALKEKFSLIERDEDRPIKAVEYLVSSLASTHHIVLKRLIIQISKERILFQQWLCLQMENQIKESTVNTKSSRFKVLMIMNQCVRLSGGDISRALKENLPLPDLIMIDGGKGHVEAVRDILENELGLDIPISGLVKDDKHRTSQLLYGSPLQIIPLERNSQEFYLLQRIQDEVHRFAITFHRQLRRKNAFNRSLMIFQALVKNGKSSCLKPLAL